MRSLTTPVAVLIGTGFAGVCVAIAVFAALRSRPPLQLEGSGGAQSVHLLPPPLPLAPVASLDKRRESPLPAAGSVEGALAAQREKLVTTCWQPTGTKAPALISARYMVRLSFDASGKQSSKGLLLPIGATRIELTACIARTLSPLTIAPQDAGVTLEVPLNLP